MTSDLLAFLLLPFLTLIALRVPVLYSVLLISLVHIPLSHRMSVSFIPQGMVSGPANYSVTCSPFFIVVGCVMNKTGAADEIFEFADCLAGHIKGGLGHVNMVVSLIFVDISGSANTGVTGLGNVEIKAMTEKGFDRNFAVGITVASSVTGPIFLPFSPMVHAEIMAEVSIGALLLDGIAVGVLMMLFMCVTVCAVARKHNYPIRKRAMAREICHAFRKSFWVLMAPVILIFCIRNENVMPTKAGAMALIHALFISMFIYKTIKFRDLYGVMAQATNNIDLALMLVPSGRVFAWALGDQQVVEIVPKRLLSLITNPWLILLLINLSLLSLGTFMESVTAITTAAPILSPIALSIRLNPVQFGVIFVLNLMMRILTPPMAAVLLITSKTGEISFEKIFKTVLPYYVALFLVLVLVNPSPMLTPGLPDLMLGGYR